MEQNIILNLNRIDRVISGQESDSDGFIVSVLDRFEADRSYLFEQLSRHFSRPLFNYLYQLGAFDFKGIPAPKVEKTADGGEQSIYYGWDAGFLIKAAADYNRIHPDSELNAVLHDLLKKYVGYALEHWTDTKRNPRPDWIMCDAIQQLPLKQIDAEYLCFLRSAMQHGGMTHVGADLATNFFDRVISENEQELILVLLDFFYQPDKRRVGMLFELHGDLEDYYLRDFASHSVAGLLKTINLPIIDWFINRITELSKEYPSAFDKFQIVSIADDEQNHHSDGLNQIIVLHLRNLLDEATMKKVELYKLTENLLKQPVAILQRIGLYNINKHFENLQPLFWQLGNPLYKLEWKLEVFKILEQNAASFSKDKIEQIMLWIGQLEREQIDNQTMEQVEKYLAYRKQEWFAALRNVGEDLQPLFRNEVKKLEEITMTQPTHPGYDSWFEMRAGGDYSKRRITELPVADIPSILDNPQLWDGYDKWGIQEDVRRLAIERTKDILHELHVFTNISSTFLYYLLDGFRTIVPREKDLDWTTLLLFLEKLLNTRVDIWANGGEAEADNSSAIGMMCWLIKEGFEHDMFRNEEVDRWIGLLVTIDTNYTRPFKPLNKEKDRNFDIINSTRGKLYEAFVSVNLNLESRKSQENTERQLHPAIKKVFDNRLNDKSYYQEFYWTIGQLTPQISYLDSAWWTGNRSLIYIWQNEIDDVAFKAYLLYASRLYENIYSGLIEYYYRAIDGYNEKSVYANKLVEHILIAAVDKQPCGNELLERIFETGKIIYLEHMVGFIDKRNVRIEEEQLRIIWKRLLDVCDKIGNVETRGIQFGSVDFIEYIKKLTTTDTELFERAMEHFIPHPRMHRLIDTLSDFIDYYPKEAGELLWSVIARTKGDFSFGSNRIISALAKLYDMHQTGVADQIAIHLAAQGNFYVKDIYNDKHN